MIFLYDFVPNNSDIWARIRLLIKLSWIYKNYQQAGQDLFNIDFRTMITVEPGAAQSAPAGKSKLKKIGLVFFILILIGGVAFSIWFFGSPKPHQETKHHLYSAFDSSAPHKKLSAGITKAKLSLLVGNKEDGLFNFVEHYANILSKKGRTIYVEQYSSLNPQVFQIAKDINTKVLATVGQLKTDCDWIVVSQNGEVIPEELIAQIQVNYPNSKILVVTTTKQQKIKGSKSFSFAKVDQKELVKSITKAFKVKPNIVEILSDYHKTHEGLFDGLEVEKFDVKEYLGEQYTSFDGISKENLKVLDDLCKSGKISSKKAIQEPVGLAPYGVIFSKKRNTPLWVNNEKILNYELFKGVNCKNEVATEDDIKEYEEMKIKQQEEKKAKEEEQKKKEEQKKAQEEGAKKAEEKNKEKPKKKVEEKKVGEKKGKKETKSKPVAKKAK